MNHSSVKALALTLAISAGLLVGACGDDEGETTSTVTETPEGGGIDGSGEIADLPLCSEAEPPCRTDDGELVEP